MLSMKRINNDLLSVKEMSDAQKEFINKFVNSVKNEIISNIPQNTRRIVKFLQQVDKK